MLGLGRKIVAVSRVSTVSRDEYLSYREDCFRARLIVDVTFNNQKRISEHTHRPTGAGQRSEPFSAPPTRAPSRLGRMAATSQRRSRVLHSRSRLALLSRRRPSLFAARP